MNKQAIPTLEDVAREAGVSTATVSRCLNAPDKVVEKTRVRVMNAVQKLGYSPNFGARALAAKRTGTIGAIIPTMANAVFARGIQAFQDELQRHGLTLLIASSSYEQKTEQEQIRTLVARGADGLLLIGHQRNPEIYSFLERQNVPVLVAWVYDPSQPTLSIGFDNHAEMKQLTQAVLDKGHRKIGVISAPVDDNDRAHERLDGVRATLRENGLSPDDLALVITPYGIETGSEAFREMMSRADPPTAVLCGNDVLAVGAMRAAKQMGISVPGDVSITGFDDIELAAVADPDLTTVHVPHRDMGRGAAEMLIAMVKGDGPSESVKLEARLCLRGSLGEPPKS